MKLFVMIRENDSSGVSGIGKVGEGVVFSDGRCVFRWTNPEPACSTVLYDTYEDFVAIHITPHPGNMTRIEILYQMDDMPESLSPAAEA